MILIMADSDDAAESHPVKSVKRTGKKISNKVYEKELARL